MHVHWQCQTICSFGRTSLGSQRIMVKCTGAISFAIPARTVLQKKKEERDNPQKTYNCRNPNKCPPMTHQRRTLRHCFSLTKGLSELHAQNIRLITIHYRQYTNLFIFWFVSEHSSLHSTHYTCIYIQYFFIIWLLYRIYIYTCTCIYTVNQLKLEYVKIKYIYPKYVYIYYIYTYMEIINHDVRRN